jgi:hypothetical protein
MKIRFFLILALIVFASCTKKEEPVLNITDTEWYLDRNILGGGSVHLIIEGYANADKVTVRTSGDGVISDVNVEMDSEKYFSKNVVISFTATGVPEGEFEVSTVVKAYKGSNVLSVPLSSGKLQY